ncbi:MAG: hypothetical protein V4611_01880 [Patescibacteria group bacterium]
MEGIVVRNWKKKVMVGVGVLACVVAMIIIGIYTTYRADANQLSNGVSAPGEADMRVDVKVDNGLAEPQSVTSATESDNVAPSSNQQEETSPNVEVRVDGTPINVPESGSVHKVINTEDGSTSIDISTQSNSSSGDSRTRSSLNVDIDSSVQVRNETR